MNVQVIVEVDTLELGDHIIESEHVPTGIKYSVGSYLLNMYGALPESVTVILSQSGSNVELGRNDQPFEDSIVSESKRLFDNTRPKSQCPCLQC